MTHSATPSCARHTEPPPRLRRRHREKEPRARGQLSGCGRWTTPHEHLATPSASKSLRGGGFSSPFREKNGPGPPAQRPDRGSLSRTGTRSRPAPHRLSLPGAPRPTDLERCFRICFLIIPAMVSACPHPSRRPAATRNELHPCARPCARWGERRELSGYPHSRLLDARRHLGRSIAW